MAEGNTVGMVPAFKCFLVSNPIESLYRTPSVTKQSASKCLEHSIECFEGPSHAVALLSLYSSNPFCMQILLMRKSMQTIFFTTLRITPSSNSTHWHSYLCSYTRIKTRHAYVFMYDLCI